MRNSGLIGLYAMLFGHDELAGIDLASEYALIKEKKSQLSRRLRNMVVYRYEKSQKSNGETGS